MRERQLELYEGGNLGYDAAASACGALLSLGYSARVVREPSPAGSWGDAIYIMTNAPIGIVRKSLRKYNVNLRDTRKTI